MTEEFIHDFMGYGRVPSQCIVKIYSDDGETMICFIDIDKGTSVTNSSEQLASEIVNKFHLRPEDCRFFETYEQYDYETFDEVEYDWWPDLAQWVARDPKWKPAEERLKDLFTE